MFFPINMRYVPQNYSDVERIKSIYFSFRFFFFPLVYIQETLCDLRRELTSKKSLISSMTYDLRGTHSPFGKFVSFVTETQAWKRLRGRSWGFPSIAVVGG